MLVRLVGLFPTTSSLLRSETSRRKRTLNRAKGYKGIAGKKKGRQLLLRDLRLRSHYHTITLMRNIQITKSLPGRRKEEEKK